MNEWHMELFKLLTETPIEMINSHNPLLQAQIQQMKMCTLIMKKNYYIHTLTNEDCKCILYDPMALNQ